jgi:ferredoxin
MVPDDRDPVPVQFARSRCKVTWEPVKGTLLDLAEAQGLEPAYSCRSGACQTCAVRVLDGTVEYVDPPAVPPPEGMALICSEFPARMEGKPVPVVLDI